jgi:hypothetical protein
MGSNTITRMSAALAGGDTATFVPAPKTAWEVNEVGSSVAFIVGGLFGSVPNVEIGLVKGAQTCIIVCDPNTDPGNRNGRHRFLISDTVNLTVKNTAGGAANVSIVGKRVIPNNVKSDIVTIPPPGTSIVTIDPGVGQGILVTEIGSDVWTVGPADINPNIDVGFAYGGLVASKFWDSTHTKGHDENLDLYVHHICQLQFTDIGAAGCDVGYCAEVASGVRSYVEDIPVVGVNGHMHVTPTDGEEWLVTGVGAEIYTVAAPNGYPDVAVAIRVGADLSDLVKAALPSSAWEYGIRARIDHTNDMQITNANAGTNEVCVSAVMVRQYKS